MLLIRESLRPVKARLTWATKKQAKDLIQQDGKADWNLKAADKERLTKLVDRLDSEDTRPIILKDISQDEIVATLVTYSDMLTRGRAGEERHAWLLPIYRSKIGFFTTGLLSGNMANSCRHVLRSSALPMAFT